MATIVADKALSTECPKCKYKASNINSQLEHDNKAEKG